MPEGILFFDVETTGVILKGVPLDDERQPKIVQLAAVLTNKHGKELASMSTLVQPRGEIPAAATAIHGLSTEHCMEFGIDIDRAIGSLSGMANAASTLVAHNLAFDSSVLQCELRRTNNDTFEFPDIEHCTMLHGTDICQIPGRYGSYKWPKLQELHQHLFGEGFDGTHDALADVRACARCYFEMIRRDNPDAKVLAAPIRPSADTLSRAVDSAVKLNAESSDDDFGIALNLLEVAAQRIKEFKDLWKAAALERVEARGDLVLGDRRWYAGYETKKKCRSVVKAFDILLEVAGGDIDAVKSCLAADAFKQGACEKLLGSRFREAFDVTSGNVLKEGEPLKKKLIEVNDAFGR